MHAPAVLLLVVTASAPGAAQPSLEFTPAEIHLPSLVLAQTTGATTSPVFAPPAPLPAAAPVFFAPEVADPMLRVGRVDDLVFAWPPGWVRNDVAPPAPQRFCAPMPLRVVNTGADAAILHAAEIAPGDLRFRHPPPVPPTP